MTFFSASDFDMMKQWSSAELAIMCNQKLQRDAKVVYGSRLGRIWHAELSPEMTHRGLLICVEEIERKICEHDAQLVNVLPGVVRWECLHCEKTMNPTKWEVVE